MYSLHLAKRFPKVTEQISPSVDQTVNGFKSRRTPWHRILILAESLSVSFAGSNETVFPRAAGIWVSKQHKLQSKWFTSHGKPEAESLPSPFVTLKPSFALRKLWNLEGGWGSMWGPGAVWITHTDLSGSLHSCWAVLGGRSSATSQEASMRYISSNFHYWLVSSLLHSFPYSRDRTSCSPRNTDLVSMTKPVSKQVELAAFNSQVTMCLQWHNQDHSSHKK